MAKTKEKKISINQFETVMKEMNTEKHTVIEWRGIDMTVRRTLQLKDVMKFVASVVASCFGDDMTYNPEAREIAFKTNVLTLYANFSMPSNLELQYDLIYTTDAYDTVLEYVNQEQLSEIGAAIEERIRYRIRANVESVQRQVSDLFAAFDNMQRQVADVFSGIGDGDIGKLIRAISEGGIDEDKLVRAYLQQKAEEVHKAYSTDEAVAK